MNYYNIVLRPPEKLAKEIENFVYQNYSDFSDQYCLSDQVFAHVTLCLFKAKSLPDIALSDVLKAPDLEKINIRQGEGIHEGFCWLEILVKSEDWIIYLHDYIKNKLSSHEVEILTYHFNPHLTLCRFKPENEKEIQDVVVPDAFLGVHQGWHIEIGKSDINGQFLG